MLKDLQQHISIKMKILNPDVVEPQTIINWIVMPQAIPLKHDVCLRVSFNVLQNKNQTTKLIKFYKGMSALQQPLQTIKRNSLLTKK